MNIKDDFILSKLNEGYLVGGAVRDFLRSENDNESFTHFLDRDIAIKNAESYAKKLADEFDATFITLDCENKIYRLVLKDKENYLDISELQGDTIENDLMRRDFTINSIAYDLKNERFIDVTGGIEDIKEKRLRAIKEENFTDDPLRILRAYRFMATTGFEPNEELLKILNKHKDLIKLPAKERIHDELMKLFGGKYTAKTLLTMLDNGILEILFPCVEEMKQVPANSHHHLDLIHHVIETVRQIEILYESSDRYSLLSNTDFGGYPRINHIKIAGFLHDIGKFSTWTLEDNGVTVWTNLGNAPMPSDKNYRHRFIKHDLEGEKLVKPLLKELKFSNKQVEYLSAMVRFHIYPSNVISAPNQDEKLFMRYIRKMGNNVVDNIILAQADRLSARGKDITDEMLNNNINGLNNLLDYYLKVKDTLKPLPKLLDGNEIMELLNLKPSPKLGEIINKLHEAQLNGEVNTRDEAIVFLHRSAGQ